MDYGPYDAFLNKLSLSTTDSNQPTNCVSQVQLSDLRRSWHHRECAIGHADVGDERKGCERMKDGPDGDGDRDGDLLGGFIYIFFKNPYPGEMI